MINRDYYLYRITDTVKTFFVEHYIARRIVFLLLIAPYFVLFLLELLFKKISPLRLWLKDNVLQFDNPER